MFKEPHDAPATRACRSRTADVRNYLRRTTPRRDDRARLPTRFPTAGRDATATAPILICEKEGFDELLQAEQVDDRYDLALMSTKGISARAARDLAAGLGVRCFTLHDFDKNGFVMAAGFPFATDIGLRIDDVDELGLDAARTQEHRNRTATLREPASRTAPPTRRPTSSPTASRVELNVLTGPEFIEFVEDEARGARRREGRPRPGHARRRRGDGRRRRADQRLIENANKQEYEPAPDDLEARVRARLEDSPSCRGARRLSKRWTRTNDRSPPRCWRGRGDAERPG